MLLVQIPRAPESAGQDGGRLSAAARPGQHHAACLWGAVPLCGVRALLLEQDPEQEPSSHPAALTPTLCLLGVATVLLQVACGGPGYPLLTCPRPWVLRWPSALLTAGAQDQPRWGEGG